MKKTLLLRIRKFLCCFYTSKYVWLFLNINLLSSCATIARSGTDVIPLSSSPENVDIQITDKDGIVVFEGQTPTEVSLRTAKSGYFNPQQYTVHASLDGYKNNSSQIYSRVSYWYLFGNMFVSTLVGWLIVDPLSGNMYYLEKDRPVINMTPLPKDAK